MNNSIDTLTGANTGEFTAVTGTQSGAKRLLDVAVASVLGGGTVGGGVYGNKAVSTAAVIGAVSTSNLTGRTVLIVHPVNGDIYWGFDTSVTTSNGMRIPDDSTAVFRVGDSQNIYFIAASSIDVRFVESL